jgi:protein-S-isoprenylcysteine O-methyltransferase Ste14
LASLLLRRHAHPAATLLAFAAAALGSGALGSRGGVAWLAAGLALCGLHWLVEWRGIAGSFEDRVPRSRLVVAARAAWLVGLVVSVVDAFAGHWTPWQGAGLRAAGALVGLWGVGLRLWSMRALAGAFSYDLKVTAGQALVRSGPYRWLRHPAYTGMLLWSAGLGLWNPSLPGLALLLPATLVQLVHRIGVEERLLAGHFGARWEEHARATSRLVPGVW